LVEQPKGKNSDIQLDPEKLRNRQFLLVFTVFICYYRMSYDVAVPFGLRTFVEDCSYESP